MDTIRECFETIAGGGREESRQGARRVKYIDALPPSPYKSAQMELAALEDMCGKRYIDRLISLMRSPH